MEPLVSIVTPSYNCERHIEETMLSVVEQDYPQIEHVIVDGASQDKTIDILKRYEGQIKWISEADSGMYEAINKGFAMAKGEILTYINSDDSYYSKDIISFIVKEFKKDDSIDFIFGHCAFTDEAGRVLYIYKAPPFNKKIALAYPRILFHQPTCFWRKRVHKGFNSSFKYCGDSIFFRYLCKYHKGKNIKRTIAKFRVREGCLAFMNKEKMSKEDQKVFGPIELRKIPFALKLYDLIYIRTILNLRANTKRFLLYCQGRPYL